MQAHMQVNAWAKERILRDKIEKGKKTHRTAATKRRRSIGKANEVEAKHARNIRKS